MISSTSHSALHIGWAQADITPPDLPVYIAGQFHIRVSEGVHDPLSATALVLESGGEHAVFVSIDTVSVSDSFRQAVLGHLDLPGLDPRNVILHATHTHAAPNNRLAMAGVTRPFDSAEEGIDLGFKPVGDYIAFAGERIAGAIARAWDERAPGGIAYGQDYAVIGRNRRWVDRDGKTTMYGLNADSAGRFDHIEGYEDHSLNLLTTYDAGGALTGMVVNVPSPSQESEHLFEISADFWHETRQELRARHGENLFILPQCSAAGDLTSHLIYETAPHRRMLQLRGRTERQEIAVRIADSVDRVVPYLAPTIDNAPIFRHGCYAVELPLNRLGEADVDEARRQAELWEEKYRAERQKVLDNPELRQEPRWYVPLSAAFNRAGWYRGVVSRHEQSRTQPHHVAQIHVMRLGEIAFATNPFEYFLDFGIQIKVKSPALQTFVVQLAGPGTYVPSWRAAEGGGYGAVPPSCPVGHQGGQQLADLTVLKLRQLWQD